MFKSFYKIADIHPSARLQTSCPQHVGVTYRVHAVEIISRSLTSKDDGGKYRILTD